MKKIFLSILAFVIGLTFAQAQLIGSKSYDLKEGSNILNGLSDDGLLTLEGTYNQHSTEYGLKMKANSEINDAEPGKTYSYNLADGSEMPQDTEIKYSTFNTGDGIVTMNSNSGKEFWYHDPTHGGVFYNGNSINLLVAGDAIVTFSTCTYSADNAIFVFTDEANNEIGTCAAENNGGDDAFAVNFSYMGPSGVITATLVADGAVYFHALSIENAAAIIPSNGLIDVWDFGAEKLDESVYNNNLSEEMINSWYSASITVGSSGNTLPGFNSGALSWIGGGNDRLRTTNTNLTRYDENVSGANGYSGRVYVNSSSNSSRYMSLNLSEDDEVTIISLSQNGSGQLNFEYVGDPSAQTDVVPILADITEVDFVAKSAGTYHIFDTQDKPSYFRIYRKDASYLNLSGLIDVTSAAGISTDYEVYFTNEAGKTWSAEIDGDSYSVALPIGYKYSIGLGKANGYVISNVTNIEIEENTTTQDISIQKVEFFTVSGSINGLDSEIENLKLAYTPAASANKIFVPSPIIDVNTSTYTVQLEPDCEYTISAEGVNDFYIPLNTITIDKSDSSSDIVFETKSLYSVTINASGIESEQLDKLILTFTNLYESDYVYTFNSVNDIALRDGTYTIQYSGLDEYPIGVGIISNLTVTGSNTEKTLAFSQLANWTFDDKVIANGITNYKGLIFAGSVTNEIAKGHLVTKEGASIQVPVNEGDKIAVTYYYSADFSIEGGESIITESGSTSTLEYAEYSYQGADAGYVTITIGNAVATTYITNIEIGGSVSYDENIYVGSDKKYKTINGALEAIRKMVRDKNERVTVMIDPDDYEEMLVIDMPNITLKNAATVPSIALLNGGVDIDEAAVRITSYYGHGYNYYSMDNQKWNADVLRVNKENGYLTYENVGSGTNNGSYWNATVVVSANGFRADDIIFENSFNQYISKKESEDVVVMWESGSKGERPIDFGNTAVQAASFIERGAAIAIVNNIDKTILYKCRVVGNQDSFYGGINSRVVIYKGAMMGGTDYLFGGMVAVFYKTDLLINTGKDSWYITAAQQSSGRGFLMYECTVKSAVPGIDNAFANMVAPGYFGRPWQANTSEVVFYNTTIETTNYPGSDGKSLIEPEGWNASLGGESSLMYEFGTKEVSAEDNQSSRAKWSTVLDEPTLSDGTAISTFNFTKGNDNWDPIPELVDADVVTDTIVSINNISSVVSVYPNPTLSHLNIIGIDQIKKIEVIGLLGDIVKTYKYSSYIDVSDLSKGTYLLKVQSINQVYFTRFLKN